jgi:hypothetical protein
VIDVSSKELTRRGRGGRGLALEDDHRGDMHAHRSHGLHVDIHRRTTWLAGTQEPEAFYEIATRFLAHMC